MEEEVFLSFQTIDIFLQSRNIFQSLTGIFTRYAYLIFVFNHTLISNIFSNTTNYVEKDKEICVDYRWRNYT